MNSDDDRMPIESERCLAVVMPCYNEAVTIREIVRARARVAVGS